MNPILNVSRLARIALLRSNPIHRLPTMATYGQRLGFHSSRHFLYASHQNDFQSGHPLMDQLAQHPHIMQQLLDFTAFIQTKGIDPTGQQLNYMQVMKVMQDPEVKSKVQQLAADMQKAGIQLDMATIAELQKSFGQDKKEDENEGGVVNKVVHHGVTMLYIIMLCCIRVCCCWCVSRWTVYVFGLTAWGGMGTNGIIYHEWAGRLVTADEAGLPMISLDRTFGGIKTALITIMEPSTHQNLHGSSHQPDYTAEPPRNTEAPWQAPVSPKGESEWNAAKDSRDHPEWNTTAYGTTNSWEQHPPSTTDSTHSTISPQQQQQGQEGKPHHIGRESGHTVQHERSPRSIRRNLNDI
ncbi:hypothetical protein [Absidia glauca]|uniref:Uncharacterized protein n=1 Tax=Absidia glauca TaxID=4829 RepID=A0A163MJR6_ABSGL|nr:hypothetical protein [Absidia glauca]